MQATRLMSLIFVTAVVACARSESSAPYSGGFEDAMTTAGTTGGVNDKGVPYTSGGDARVGSTVFDSASPKTPAPVTSKLLKDRLKSFEISRFDADGKVAKRFGNKTVEIKAFFKDLTDPVVFRGPLLGAGDSHSFSVTVGALTLRGNSLNDLRAKPTDLAVDQTKGDFDLIDAANKDQAKIWYWAFTNKLRVHEDADHPIAAGSDAAAQIQRLKDNTFGWRNNWGVDGGVSTFVLDIVKRVHTTDPAQEPSLIFSAQGESLQMDGDRIPDQSRTSDYSNVETVGNAQNEGLLLLSAQVQDKQTKETHEIILDVEQSDPNSLDTQDDDDDSGEYSVDPGTVAANPPSTSYPQTSGRSVIAPTPHSGTAGRTTPAVAVETTANSYLRIDLSRPRTARMHHDLTSRANQQLPGVIKNKALFLAKNSKLMHFFYYAYPLRNLIDAISATYDVAPVWATLPVNESAYFSAGYNNRQTGDPDAKTGVPLAHGPFQFHWDAAHDSGVAWTTDNNDERWYYAPSACGAANLIAQKVKPFLGTGSDGKPNDTTLAVLAYNRGGKGAQDLARQFNFHYATISRAGSVKSGIRDYVDRQIAVYLIVSDLQASQLMLKSFVNLKMPPGNTIMPPRPIADATCRALVSAQGFR